MRRIQKILFATHFKYVTYATLKRILPLAEAGLAEVVFLNVLDRDEVGFVPYGGFDTELANELIAKANLTFADWGKTLTERGLEWKGLVEVGDPEPKILEVAEREAVDLIIVGRHSTLIDKIYPSGVEAGILRDAKVPVVLVPPEEDEAECIVCTFDNVLLAVDFSAPSAAAFDLLCTLSAAIKELRLLHVVPSSEVDGLTQAETEELNADRADKLMEFAQRAKNAGIKVDTHLLAGDVAEEVLSFAQSHDSTVIALGTRGRRGIQELIMGSVSHEVAMTSPIPVILVNLT